MSPVHDYNRAEISDIDFDPDEEERWHDEQLAKNNSEVRRPTSSWDPVDLGPVLDGSRPPDVPRLLMRDDGVPILYPAKKHSFFGESESGKTWVGLLAVKQELVAGNNVMMFDFEADEVSIVERLRAMLVPDDAIAAKFRYVRPDAPLETQAEVNHLVQTITDLGVTLAVLDGVTEAMTLHGLDLRDNGDIARFMLLLPTPLARTGAAVLQVDHVTKDRESRGRFAIGGQHKLAAIDGAAFTVEMVKPFGRGLSGVARVSVAKDRPGWIRRHAVGGLVGELRLESDPDGGVGIELCAPAVEDSGFRPTVLMERVSRALEENTAGLSKRALRAAVKGKSDAKDLAIEMLIAEGFVTVEQDGQSRRHLSARQFRQVPEGNE